MPQTGPEQQGSGSIACISAEGESELRAALDLALEIRQELANDPMSRKVALYERTLGLAVLPVLARRAAYGLWYRIRDRRLRRR